MIRMFRKSPLRSVLLIGLGVIVLWGVALDSASACPTCKDGLAENDPAGQAIAAGYFWSILFMMSMPFLLIGSFASYAYYIIQRANRQAGDAASGPPLNASTYDAAGHT